MGGAVGAYSGTNDWILEDRDLRTLRVLAGAATSLDVDEALGALPAEEVGADGREDGRENGRTNGRHRGRVEGPDGDPPEDGEEGPEEGLGKGFDDDRGEDPEDDFGDGRRRGPDSGP